MSYISKNIRYLRKKKRMSQPQLGEILGKSESTIQMWETGFRSPTMGSVKEIADYFNLSIDEIMNEDLESDSGNIQVHLPSPEQGISIPVYSSISCGTGLFVDDEVIETISLPLSLFPNKSAEYFAQYAEGDSMINAGINAGDLIIFKKSSTIENGQIGCFCIDNNIATCKKYSRNGGEIYLLPQNDNYSPIRIDIENECFRVIGIKVLLITKG